MTDALGILEVTGLTPAMVALDTMDKTSGVRLLQLESNDFYGVVLKVTGSQAEQGFLAAPKMSQRFAGMRQIRRLQARDRIDRIKLGQFVQPVELVHGLLGEGYLVHAVRRVRP